MENDRVIRPAITRYARRLCEGLSDSLRIALDAKRGNPVTERQSCQEDLDRQAVERAENEGMLCSPRGSTHPKSGGEMPRGRQSVSITGHAALSEDVAKRGL